MGEYRIEERGRRCLECGDEMVEGRSDRKFCCTSCKNAYNNRRSHELRAVRIRVGAILERNHDILLKLLSMGLKSMDIVSLTRMGFNTHYCTSSEKVLSHEIRWCYDVRYSISATRIFGIEREK